MSNIISDIKSSDRSFRINLQDGKVNLKNGELINATVVRRLPEGGIMLSVNGRQLNVPNGPYLPEGSRHLFQATITGSRVELKLVETPVGKAGPPVAASANVPKETLAGIMSELKNALDQAGLGRTSAQAAQNLRQLMPLILYANPKSADGVWLKENIMAGGMFWESKVTDFLTDEKSGPLKRLLRGDLKGILLALQKGLLAKGDEADEALMAKIRQALNLIEENQQLNLSALEQNIGWLFFIPGFGDDGFIGAEIFAKKRDEKGGIFFSVLLEFTQLGRFQANVYMTDAGTSVRMLMDDEERAKLVNDNLHLLEKGLSALDIKNVNVSCHVRNGEESIEDMVPDLRKRKQNLSILV